MKKQSILFNLLGIVLCGMTAPVAADYCNPYCNQYCEWSFCDGKIKLGADWLYWKATEDNLLIGSVANVEGISQPLLVNASAVKQNFKYDSGFRVNLGYELPCDCWDVNVCYTYFPSHSKSATFTTTDTSVSQFQFNSIDFPIFLSLQQEGFAPVASMRSKWNLTANNIDVDLGRTLCCGECLKIRPHIGFRATWFDQTLRVITESSSTDEPRFAYNARFKEKFTGYGVEGGLWGEWQVGCGLSVVGHFGGSILYSKFRTHENVYANITSPEPSELIAVSASGTVHSGTPTMDYFVGLQYADCFCDMLFSVRAGWEQHVLFDVNRLGRDGNLATQGLTLGMEVGF